jgi:Fe-S-cluster-containing dehydrogenase component
MKEPSTLSRRDFIRNMAIGAGGLVFIGSFGVYFRVLGKDGKTVKGIVIDYKKCTGCRTCETVCSAINHPQEIEGELMNGMGNPYLSNIRVRHFNPDIDIPMVCSLCEDSPCINACPIPPDLFTGHKAMYHDTKTATVRNDRERCIGCGQCAKACRNMRTGVIYRDQNGKPFGMCTLCDGDPQCIKYCSFGAIAYAELNDSVGFRKQAPEKIAKQLIKELYEIDIEL